MTPHHLKYKQISRHHLLKSGGGFTLPELLVALLMFSLVVGAATNLLLSAIAGQRASLAMQEVVDQSSFVAEYMTRALRQAQKDLGPTCLSSRGLNYELTKGGEGIKFVNLQGECQEFFLETGRIKESLAVEQFLTSDNVQITFLQFAVQGESQEDDIQPRVTFAFTMEESGTEQELQLQTSVSQRNVDIVK